jgi:cell division protein FtsN
MSRDFAAKQKKAESNVKVPRWALLVAIILVGSLGMGLVYLIKNVPDSESDKVSDAVDKAVQNKTLQPSAIKKSKAVAIFSQPNTTAVPIPTKKVVIKAVSIATAKPTLVVTPLPKVDSSNLDFYHDLKNAEVKNVTPKQQKQTRQTAEKNSNQWKIQVASFKSQDQADSLRAKLMLQGMTEAYTEDSGNYVRVMLGPLKNKRTAEKYRNNLSKMGMNVLLKEIK